MSASESLVWAEYVSICADWGLSGPSCVHTERSEPPPHFALLHLVSLFGFIIWFHYLVSHHFIFGREFYAANAQFADF